MRHLFLRLSSSKSFLGPNYPTLSPLLHIHREPGYNILLMQISRRTQLCAGGNCDPVGAKFTCFANRKEIPSLIFRSFFKNSARGVKVMTRIAQEGNNNKLIKAQFAFENTRLISIKIAKGGKLSPKWAWNQFELKSMRAGM